ncbi:hypothetical protein BCR36DRAFT_582854 [Piromyces finnis]|uniref:Fucosyltransferase n=1 Tax=Piromyces finnis TaxID=1754191 RepID=A0A1Y1VD94_9FUNG|nr:hypothetical protein BCR36DRAFT_582854 [Piromyces finnis]|eukprot:ORX51817.1 hypothetical protein BCR36DRAFT_582854 [Piromyces finnis]
MVNKLFSIRRLRTCLIFTGVGMIFVLLFLIFFKDEKITDNIERTRKLALKSQNVVNLKELTDSINEPLRTNPLKYNNKNEKGKEGEDETLEDLYNNNKLDSEVERYEYEKIITEDNENDREIEKEKWENENGIIEEQILKSIKENINKKMKGKKKGGKKKSGHKKKPKIPVYNPNNNNTNTMSYSSNENETEKKEETNKKPKETLDFSTKEFFKLYHKGPNYRDGDDPKGLKCPVPWTWTDDEEESDIIVMNVLDNLFDIMRIEDYDYDKSRQKLLLMSMESVSNYDVMVSKKDKFDYFIDYRLDSDVPIPYSYTFFDFSKTPVPTKYKGLGGRGLAAVFISNCAARNKRLEFLSELMKYAKIDSFGMCNNNKNVYDEDIADSSWNTKMNTIRKYKFTLAFENSDDRDYVTEKFFQPLEVGSVPIFFGTSNIADFAPPHSYIDAKDFENAQELAEYLEYLDKNDDEYEKYLEWKKTGNFGENLEHLIEIRKFNSICQLLQRIKGLWINPYLTIWDRKDVPENERACGLC